MDHSTPARYQISARSRPVTRRDRRRLCEAVLAIKLFDAKAPLGAAPTAPGTYTAFIAIAPAPHAVNGYGQLF